MFSNEWAYIGGGSGDYVNELSPLLLIKLDLGMELWQVSAKLAQSYFPWQSIPLLTSSSCSSSSYYSPTTRSVSVKQKASGLRCELNGKFNLALSSDSDRQKALEAAINDINSSFGKGSVTRLGSAGGALVETFPSGCLTLDFALGGGLPKGRIVEIYGPESSGKTTLALHAIAEVQRLGGNAMLVDAEHAFDAAYSKALGVDVENLIVCQPDNGEMALEIADRMCRSGAIDLICIDSVSALTPRAEIEGEIGMQQMGLQARLMSQALRKMSGNASKAGCTLIFLNQIRHKSDENFEKFKKARRAARKAVRDARAKFNQEVYAKLDTKDAEKNIYKLARKRDRKTKNIGRVKCVKDMDHKALVRENEIKEMIQKNEVRMALKKMGGSKEAQGPNGIPIEVWRCLGESGIAWVTMLFNNIWRDNKMPTTWRKSIIVPLYKNKVDVQDCSNYRGIELMSHTMKLWKHIMEQRLRKCVDISHNQFEFGFMPRRSTMEAICIMRQLMEHYQDKKIGVYYGNPEVTSGGIALKFFASLRLEIRTIGKVKSVKGDEDVGVRARVRVQKSKVRWFSHTFAPACLLL
ncbi:hypothetical protein KSS87_018633 [Heliosperma pusillum]|nr:hypothetical protein KSS87_018633 [Heliosperma pusillum]